MGDVETEVYAAVSARARALFPGLRTASAAPATEPEFPFAMIEMTEAHDVPATKNSQHEGEATRVRFDVDVYSARTVAPKAEAMAISDAISDAFRGLGFTQTAGGRPIDLTDERRRSIARYGSRFEAVVMDGVIHTF